MLPGILFSSVSCHALVGAACLLQAIGCVCLHTVVGGNRTSTFMHFCSAMAIYTWRREARTACSSAAAFVAKAPLTAVYKWRFDLTPTTKTCKLEGGRVFLASTQLRTLL